MSTPTIKRQYNRFTLRPIDPKMIEPYFEFNCEEILFLRSYFTLMSGSFFLGVLVVFIPK